jgi:hypothetical protein
MKANIRFFSRQDSTQLLILIFAWILVQVFLIWRNGIVTGLESAKYIEQAQHLISFGKLSTANFRLYATEIFLIVFALKLHLGFVAVVIIQHLLNIFATIMFYRLAFLYLNSDKFLAFFVTLIFVLNIPYQTYNSYLFTESIFYSLSVIYSSYLVRLRKLNFGNGLTIFSLLILLSVTRPTGILFFIPTIFYLLFNFFKGVSIVKKIVFAIVGLVLLALVINLMLGSGGSLDFMLPFKKENIICGVNTTENAPIKILENGNSLQALGYYIVHNLDRFLRLCYLKTILFFGFTREYYSTLHNWLLRIFYYPLFLLAIVGIVKRSGIKDKATFYFLGVILFFWISILLTCVNWQNRFVLTITPFVFLPAFAAFSRVTKAQIGNGD